MLCPVLTCFDDNGDKTNVPDKERQIEAFQLLFMLLPPANRSMLKLLLDLLYHTARKQHINKMSAINLATMFAPHIIWPKNVRTLGSFSSTHHVCSNYPHYFCDQVNLNSFLEFVWHCVFMLKVMASDLQGNIEQLNKGIAFLIRHSQKLFKVSSFFFFKLFFR